MDIERLDLEEWDSALPSSGAGVETFHDPDALAVLDAHTDAEMRLYGAFKGQQAVGLLPVFVEDRPVGRTVFSPPVSMGVPRLGPIINPNSPKRRKWERINAELAAGVLEDVDADRRSTLFRMTCPVGYDDPRPYGWNDLSVEPEFTYVVDLEGCTDVEDAMSGFSKSLRNEMRRYDDLDLRIETEGIDAALRIYEDVVDQYAEYDDEAPMTRQFLRDLLASLEDDRWRTYVARSPDGTYQSGILTLFSNDLAYYWQGGVTASYEHVSVNNLLHRRILEDIVTDPELESITGYDLVGANTERLCEYKGKFNGELRPYYVIESSGLEMQMAKKAYQRVSGSLK
ncbi:GNAT family N-acetyltransferase [Natronobacterium texcoconense]|uniref:Acetyltransferase (GNAT) domain-containing protein n=1 Tax=Natronobacterium texcoconense TaxID=1095778 RepID=A0A1H1F703_NATTX|nr:GNAT family N-acetyltransferase [Natronobacterium texcoconense]SDQ96793.1 Acetyltransferase (GNAT) domain-containing protein [Natronobacterium texcoconense]